MTTFIYILIMLLILGVLISLHELGHLAFAKFFHVYCFDYSIGFGPSFLHVKRKGGETYFSLRWIPLGGYVSMYGEPGVAPEGVEPPPASRSIEGIAKWKKCIVLLAGVVTNYLLGLILIFVSVSCFTQYYYGYSMPIKNAATEEVVYVSSYAPATFTGDYLASFEAKKDPVIASSDYYFYQGTRLYPTLNEENASSYGPIVDSDVVIYNKDGSEYQVNGETIHFVALYTPTNLTSAHTLSSALHLYPASSVDPASVDPLYAQLGITHFPDVPASSSDDSKEFKTSLMDNGEVYFNLDTKVFAVTKNEDGTHTSHFDEALSLESKITIADKAWSDPGLSISVVEARNSWGEAWEEWAYYVPESNTAIIKGIGSLFTPSGWKNASGIVGMTASLTKMNDAATIFLYAGLISINLAFFNLLPFPGLDGWALLVTIIEGSVNSVKRGKFKKAHPGEKIVDYLPPMEDEDKKKSQEKSTKSDYDGAVPPVVEEAEPEETEKAPSVPPVELKEGEVLYTKWRIPAKIKGWVSLVGLGLLFLFAIIITIKDIVQLF